MHDGIRPVFFGFPILPEVIVIFGLEIKVRAVVVKNSVDAFAYLLTVAVDGRFYLISVMSQERKAVVNIVKFGNRTAVHSFTDLYGRALGNRIDDPGTDQRAKDVFKTVLYPVLFSDILADLSQAQHGKDFRRAEPANIE